MNNIQQIPEISYFRIIKLLKILSSNVSNENNYYTNYVIINNQKYMTYTEVKEALSITDEEMQDLLNTLVKFLLARQLELSLNIFCVSTNTVYDIIDYWCNIKSRTQEQTQNIQNFDVYYIALLSNIHILNTPSIEKFLKSESLTQPYTTIVLDAVESTNTYILSNLENLKPYTCVASMWQYRGRGRVNKQWYMRPILDLTASILYTIPYNTNLQLIPLIVSVALIRLLTDIGIEAQIKWPNDIYIKQDSQYTKIAGILVETKFNNVTYVDPSSIYKQIIIGVGLDNINNHDNNHLLSLLIKHLDNLLFVEYLQNGFKNLSLKWLNNCMHYNKEVSLYRGAQLIITGIHVGVNIDGSLLIKDNYGKILSYDLSNMSLTTNLDCNYFNNHDQITT